MYRLGKIKFSERRPRPILLRLSSEWYARKHLAKADKRKNFQDKVFFSKSLNRDEQAVNIKFSRNDLK